MSETTPESTPAPETDAATGPGTDEFKSDESKKALLADLSKEREQRKALQSRLDEIDRASETAVEKAQREAQEAKAEIEKLPSLVASELRVHLIELHDISDEQAELYLTSTDPAVLRKQAAGIAARTSTPKPDPSQGAKGSDAKGTTADMFAAAIEPHFTR